MSDATGGRAGVGQALMATNLLARGIDMHVVHLLPRNAGDALLERIRNHENYWLTQKVPSTLEPIGSAPSSPSGIGVALKENGRDSVSDESSGMCI